MAEKRPLCNYSGDIKELQSGDTLPASGSANLDDGTAQGQMAFWDDAESSWTYTETNELFWNDTNKRFRIQGNSEPQLELKNGDDDSSARYTELDFSFSDGVGPIIRSRRPISATNTEAILDFYTEGTTSRPYLTIYPYKTGEDGSVVINDDSSSVINFRVKSDTNTNMLFVDAGNNRVGIGTNTPNALLDVDGDTNLDGAVVINESGSDVDFRVESNTNANMLFIDAGNNRVGIGTDTPDVELDISGSVYVQGSYGKTVIDDYRIEIGDGNTSNITYIDMKADSTYTDYGLRIRRNTGANGTSYIQHRGTGALSIQAQDGGYIDLVGDGDRDYIARLFQSNSSYHSGFVFAISGVRSFITGVHGGTFTLADGSSTIGSPFLIRTGTDLTDDTREYFIVDGDGILYADGVYANNSGIAANMRIDSNGEMYFSTSSIKFKTDIEDIEDTYSEKIYDFRPVWFRSTCAKDRKDWSHFGFIAEELDKIEPRLVEYKQNKDGSLEPMSVQYDRITALLVKEMQKLRNRITELEGICQQKK